MVEAGKGGVQARGGIDRQLTWLQLLVVSRVLL